MYDWLLHLVQTYPELIAIAVSLAVASAASETLRMVWFPQDWTERENWRVMSLVDILFSYGFCHTLWRTLDPDRDSHLLILTGSLAVALSSVFIHMTGRRIVLKRWPWIEPKPPNPEAAP